MFAPFFTKAQDTLNFQQVDKLSYALYEQSNWKELTSFCNTAIKNNYDYYYLRLRAGIAAYELKHYRSAIAHFKKAIEFNSDDVISYEYLYYCYLYCNRPDAARALSSYFSPEFSKHMKTQKLSVFSDISAEAGTKLSDSLHLFKPANFAQLGINHYIGRRLLFAHVFNIYEQKESRFRVTQAQYYLRLSMPLKNEMRFTAATHVIYDYTTLTQNVVSQYTVQDPPPRQGAPLPPVRTLTTITVKEEFEQSMGFAAALALTKHCALADFEIGMSTLVLDSVKQGQLNGGVWYYPFKNNTLSVGLTANLHNNNKTQKFKMAWSPQITAHIYKGFYVNACYFSNTGLNVTEQNALFINNSYDYTLQRLTLSPSYVFSRKLSVYGTIGFEEKKQINSGFIYHYNLFSLGLRINPFKNN
ncbi:MAG: hypothetical protein IT236_05145 [Bacteroidia bacterium]|nr:hypothetical protein [Bacteroidia bacterium]